MCLPEPCACRAPGDLALRTYKVLVGKLCSQDGRSPWLRERRSCLGPASPRLPHPPTPCLCPASSPNGNTYTQPRVTLAETVEALPNTLCSRPGPCLPRRVPARSVPTAPRPPGGARREAVHDDERPGGIRAAGSGRPIRDIAGAAMQAGSPGSAALSRPATPPRIPVANGSSVPRATLGSNFAIPHGELLVGGALGSGRTECFSPLECAFAALCGPALGGCIFLSGPACERVALGETGGVFGPGHVCHDAPRCGAVACRCCGGSSRSRQCVCTLHGLPPFPPPPGPYLRRSRSFDRAPASRTNCMGVERRGLHACCLEPSRLGR